jgi:hypothetical protein
MKLCRCQMVMGVLLLIVVSCQHNPLQTPNMHLIRLTLKPGQRPAELAAVAPTSPPALAKMNELVAAQVVLLHCDEDSGYQAVDASAYGNSASLANVARTDSSATPTLKKALDFQLRNSYALLPTVGELNATYGFTIEFYFYLKPPFSIREQCLLDRLDSNGGYRIGLKDGHVYLSVNQLGKVQTIVGGSTLAAQTWYHLKAYFEAEKIGVQLNDKTDAESGFVGTITSSSRQTLLGAGYSGTSLSLQFWGRMDEISITTKVEYEDFDAIRVMVFDLNTFDSMEAFSYSTEHQAYHLALTRMLEDSAYVPTWALWKSILTDYFDLASESVLVPKGGFAEGTVQGVSGINYVVIGALKKNELAFIGYSVIVVFDDRQLTDAEIEIWQP